MPLFREPVRLTLRSATTADIPTLRELAERTWHAAYRAMLPPGQIDYMLAWMYAPEQIARELAEGVAWELALIDGEPVGFFSVTLENDQRAKLNKLYVLPERQRQGVGRTLLECAHALAAKHGTRVMWLQVNKQNERAIATYRRAGYTVAREAVFDIGGGFVMDDFVMELPLSPTPVNENASSEVSA